MNTLPLLLAQRLLSKSSSEIASVARLAFIAIAISSGTLALVAAIGRGFEAATHHAIQGMHADLVVSSGRGIKVSAVARVLEKEYADQIAAWTPTATCHVLVETDSDNTDHLTVAHLTALDPQRVARVTSLETTIKQPQNRTIAQLVTGNNVILGSGLARDLNLSVGDTFTLTYAYKNEQGKLQTHAQPARLSGLATTGLDEFDSYGIFSSLNYLQHLREEDSATSITQLHLKLAPGADATAVKNALAQRLSLSVHSWQELYPQLLAALTLERYAQTSILVLIVLCTSTTLIALIFMFVTYKQRMIGLLHAFGMAPRNIAGTFIAVGTLLSLSAATVGLSIATLVSYLIDRYRLIKLPDVYYVEYLPAPMSGTILALVMILVLTMSILASWYPTRSIRRNRIATILKGS